MLGCVISWNSVAAGHTDERRHQRALLWLDGHYRGTADLPLVCVNPLSWTPDGQSPAGANPGSVYSAGRDAPMPAPVLGVTGARCAEELLEVSVTKGEYAHFSDPLTWIGSYHDFDYSLFYVSVRNNALARLRQFAAGTGH